jgi:NADPH:quinone reductase-like Zn-dependent oxidoreductase
VRAVVAQQFGGPGVLAEVDIAAPSPISTEVLVEVHAAGVNPVDYKTRGGEGVAKWAGPPPFVPGWDVAGVVVSTGYGVTRFAPCDRVFGMPRFPRAAGAYAEYVTAPSLHLARIPDELGFVEAAAIPLAALTAWQVLFDAARLKSDQTLLVDGASGGVGHLAVQLAAARGARVLALARAQSHEFLAALGASELIAREIATVEQAAAAVDVVLDLVGGSETAAALTTLKPGGVMLAVADGADDATHVMARELGVRVLEPLVEPDGRSLDAIAELASHGSIRVAVESVLPLESAAEAHAQLESGGTRGKIVLAVRNP